jgi:hypothetical protein
VLAHDAEADAEAEPGAVLGALGGEKWIEDAAEVFGGMPTPLSLTTISAVRSWAQASTERIAEPRAEMASMALSARLKMTCLIWEASA